MVPSLVVLGLAVVFWLMAWVCLRPSAPDDAYVAVYMFLFMSIVAGYLYCEHSPWFPILGQMSWLGGAAVYLFWIVVGTVACRKIAKRMKSRAKNRALTRALC